MQNEPQQYILLNAWIIERWYDEFLYWNPLEYSNITELRLPYDVIWMPDTTLYNSLVMKDDDTRRLLNAKLTTNTTRRAVLIDLLYPAIFKFSCLLTLRYFPYDLQVCTMTFSSWTYDQKGIDYHPYASQIGTSNFLENEGWYLLQTSIKRKEVKYSCCPNNYTLLKLTLYLRRKPLFYLINLIIPTSIITLIAIVGFFTTSSASGMREEKVSLGITTLLSMSILMLMVSDQMPTTSTFIPLIGWFILCTIILISLGTLASTVVIAVQKRGRLGERLSQRAIHVTRFFGCISITEVPLHIRDASIKRRTDGAGGLDSAKSVNFMPKAKVLSENAGNQRQQQSSNRGGSISSAVSQLHTDVSTSSQFSQLFSCLQSSRCRQKRRATDSLVPDKSTDLLMMKAIRGREDGLNSGSTVLIGPETNRDNVFRFSPAYINSKTFQKRNVKDQRSPDMSENGGILSAKSPLVHPFTPLSSRNSAFGGQQRREVPDISALITANLVASSAVAASPNLQRLSLHGVFEDSDAADEDGASELDGLTPTANRFATTVLQSGGVKGGRTWTSGRSGVVTPSQLAQQARTFNENIRQNRLLAQKEYEWVATVLERCCFIIFVIVFFVLTLGINFIGYYHWSDIDSALRRGGDERHI